MAHRRFPLPPRRQPAQNAPQVELTPADFDALAQKLTTAGQALTAAAQDWQSALEAGDATRVALARVHGMTAAAEAGLALRLLIERT